MNTIYDKYLKDSLKIEEYHYQEDVKYHAFYQDFCKVVNVASGYSFSLPTIDFKYDYELSELRCKYYFDDCILTTSFENKNPYGKPPYVHTPKRGWEIYLDEWLIRYISHPDYLKVNQISKVEETIIDDHFLKQYELIRFAYVIEEAGQIQRPYYNIAIIRPKNEYTNFYLFVMKSKTNQVKMFKEILQSFQIIPQIGKAKNIQQEYPLCIDENWNEMTKKYFNKLLNQETVDWGIFTKSIVNEDDSAYDYIEKRLTQEVNRFDALMDKGLTLFPTYMHISWQGHIHHFPMTQALKYAGGDGLNHKKVLHFTFQYTANDNQSFFGYSPTFDILRGKYDDYFRELARQIKKYHYPVLFRLNNEMNTDWTSYSGITSLLDPDLFILSWSKLFDIFKEEKVDNCIWIFNPIGNTTPFSNWGEYLNYYPKNKVHMLGLTYYERGNEEKFTSFKELYSTLYEKNIPYFKKYPHIISEFGVGCGGEIIPNYEKGGFDFTLIRRNLNKQVKWVKEMFDNFDNKEEYTKNIKAAIWFSANDYGSVEGKNYIMNYFQLDEEVMPTILALKEGINK